MVGTLTSTYNACGGKCHAPLASSGCSSSLKTLHRVEGGRARPGPCAAAWSLCALAATYMTTTLATARVMVVVPLTAAGPDGGGPALSRRCSEPASCFWRGEQSACVGRRRRKETTVAPNGIATLQSLGPLGRSRARSFDVWARGTPPKVNSQSRTFLVGGLGMN